MENKETQKQDSGLPSRSLNCSAARQPENLSRRIRCSVCDTTVITVAATATYPYMCQCCAENYDYISKR